MLVIRFVALIGLLFLVGLGIAFVATRDRKYLRLAGRTAQVLLLLVVAFALFYVFERVLLL